MNIFPREKKKKLNLKPEPMFQSAFTCSKSTIKPFEQCVKSIQN